MSRRGLEDLLLGVGIGLGIGLLISPNTGEENRKILKEKGTDLINKAKENITVDLTDTERSPSYIINAIKNNPFVTQEEPAQIVGIARKNIIANMKIIVFTKTAV